MQYFFDETVYEEQGIAFHDDTISPLFLNDSSPLNVSTLSEIEDPVATQPLHLDMPSFFSRSSDLIRVGSYGDQVAISLENAFSPLPLVRTNSLQLPSIPSHNSLDYTMGFNEQPSVGFLITPFEESLPPSDRADIPSEVILVDNPLSEESTTESTVVDIPQHVSSISLPPVPLVQEQEQDSSDDDWLNGRDSTNINTCKSKPISWTKEECNRLREGVAQYGSSGYWKEVSKIVGTRSVSQCINKWKNDLCKSKTRWNRAATAKLISYLKKGLSDKEIAEKMPEYTYIQLYQQIQKHSSNQQPWEDWEINKLIELKKEGVLFDTQIGRKLNNRHRDAVKNMWNRIKNSECF